MSLLCSKSSHDRWLSISFSIKSEVFPGQTKPLGSNLLVVSHLPLLSPLATLVCFSLKRLHWLSSQPRTLSSDIHAAPLPHHPVKSLSSSGEASPDPCPYPSSPTILSFMEVSPSNQCKSAHWWHSVLPYYTVGSMGVEISVCFVHCYSPNT